MRFPTQTTPIPSFYALLTFYLCIIPQSPLSLPLSKSSPFASSPLAIVPDFTDSMASTSTSGHQSEIKTEYAFDEIAPPSASISAPPDVFINYCGFDVKSTLAPSICRTLRGRGLKVLLDSEELPSAEGLPAVLEHSASLCIAIFSRHYAESTRILAQLSFMLKTGRPIIPVFYNVQPYDLRWVAEGKGLYADAFLKHERNGRYSLENLNDWKKALHIVSLNWGEIITNDDKERMMLKTIANHVLEVMQTVPLEVAKHPVDLQEAVADFEMITSPTPLQKLPIKKLPYDAFINHRGLDVENALARSIYNVLCGMGLRVFLDFEELQFGDFLPAAILQGMRSAFLNVVIISPGFAESPWCLAELSFMFKIGTPIFPVFYHVQPADMQYTAKGMYAKDLSYHQEKGGYSFEEIEEWRMALQRVSFIKGYVIKNDDDEQRLFSEKQRVLKNIVNIELDKKRKVTLEVAKHPVGLEKAVTEFEMVLYQSAKCHSNVQIVGICGVDGSGKTTLAKEIYNRKYQTMRRSTFLSDVRDAGVKGLLVEKQKKLLEDFGVKGATFENVEQGKRILQSILRSVSVLIILDGVDHKEQVDALLPAPQSLGVGSLVIVTTSNSDFLKAWGISTIYQTKPLNATHAKELLCWHAFSQPSPLFGFEDLVEEFILASDNLPLSLIVLGGQLYGRSSKDYWQDQLHEISKIVPGDIKSRLRVSYEDLHEEEKQTFLDIASFFIGEKKGLAIAIWDGCRWNGVERLKTLMSKSLVELDHQSCIRMQGPLRELGREIAKEQPPYRLWSSTQIQLINRHAEDTLRIRGIMAAITQFSACSAHHEFPSYSSPYQPPFEECLKIMQNSISRSYPRRPLSLGLKFLVVTGDDFSSKFAKLSEELVWLRWFDFKHATLPSWKSLKNLRILELYGATALKELWKDGTHPPFKQLTELNITCSWGSGLQRFPSSISDLKHLKKIALIGYLGDEFPIKRLPEEFCDLKKLEHLELRLCRVLSSLPSRFGELTMLRHLDLSSCVELRILPVSFKQLTHLEYLDLSGCRKLTFRLDLLENISKLQKLDLSGCRRLQELPHGIASQAYLIQLNMRDTRLRNMASNMDQLRKLLTLQIGSPSLRSLPPSLGYLSSLTHLTIFDCPNLESLPESLGLLGRLEHLCIQSSGVKCLPESLIQLARLQAFEISGCPIRELDFAKGSSCLSSLKVLHIVDTQVSWISISDDCCPVLKTLQLLQNEVLVEIVTLPTSLEEIELWECERLEDISRIQDLTNLKYQEISGCPKLDDSI